MLPFRGAIRLRRDRRFLKRRESAPSPEDGEEIPPKAASFSDFRFGFNLNPPTIWIEVATVNISFIARKITAVPISLLFLAHVFVCSDFPSTDGVLWDIYKCSK